MDLAKLHSSENGSFDGSDDSIDLIVIGYTTVGALKSGFGTVQVEARETILSESRKVAHCVKFELTSGGDYPQTSVAVVQYENLSPLLSVLRKLSSATIERDRFMFTEIRSQVDEITFIVFNNDRGETMWATQAEGMSIHFASLSKINDLIRLVEKAQAHLNAVKR